MHWDLDAAVKGATDRLVPILMTSIVTGLGILPLALGRGDPGREIQGPMAVVILGGLLSSMALNLLVLPTLALRYGYFGPARDEFDRRRRHSARPSDAARSIASIQRLPDRARQRECALFDRGRNLADVADRFAPILEDARAPFDLTGERGDLGWVLARPVLQLMQRADVGF